MSTKKKYGVDPRAKAAAECYIALESAQSSISISIGVPDAMRAARYTTDEAKDKTLQVQVRREVERIKRDNVDPASLNPASIPTVATTAASHTAGTRRRSETVTNAAATMVTTGGPALDIDELVTSPIRKIRKTSAQAQVEKEISTYHKHHSVYFRQRRRRILSDSTGLYRVRIEMHSGRG